MKFTFKLGFEISKTKPNTLKPEKSLYKNRFILLITLFGACFCAFGQVAVENENNKKIEAIELKTEMSFSEGMKYYLIEEYEKAKMEFKKNILTYGNTPAVNFMLSKTELALNQVSEALLSAKKVVDKDDTNFYYWLHLGELEQKQFQYKAASSSFKKAQKLNKRNRNIYIKLCDAYLLDEKPKDALKILDEMEEEFGFQEMITEKKQQILVTQNKVDAALKVGNKAAANDPEFNLKQAVILIESKKFKEAASLLENTIKQNPNITESYSMLADVYAQVGAGDKLKELVESTFINETLPFAVKFGAYSNYMLFNKNNAGAQPELNKMLDNYIKKYPNEARPYLFKGDMLVKENQVLAGRDSYLKAVKIDANIFEAWLAITELDVRLGNFKEMKAHTEKALEYFPNQGYFWYHNGFALMQLNEAEDALISFEEAKNLSKTNKELYNNILCNIGNLYAEKGDVNKAKSSFESVLAIEPNNEQALNDFSFMLAMKKIDLNKSLTLAEKLISIHPKQAGNFDTYALVLAKNSKFDKAIEAINKAIGMNNVPNFIERKGDIYFWQGKLDLALEQWKLASNVPTPSKELLDKINAKKIIE